MTKTLDVYIGELRPWPDTVNVIRGKTDETRRFMPEELGTRALLDGAALMGENRRLRESNDMLAKLLGDRAADCHKLADLVADMLVTVRAAGRLGVDVGKVEEYGRRAHELGIEVDG